MTSILYHFTCDHGRAGLEDRGVLRPWSHGLVWLTDLDVPLREPLGLTSNMLSCDRTKHRYRVTDDSHCHWWIGHPRRDRSIEIDGTRPMHWWVSEEPVPVVFEPVARLAGRVAPDMVTGS